MQKKKTARATIDAGYTYSEQCIDELLKLAGADNGPESRTDLLNALQLAHLFFDAERESASRQRPLSKQIVQLEHSIEKTRKLLRGIRKYEDVRDVGFVTQPVGRGVIEVATIQEIIRGRELELPQHSSISDGELILPTIGMGDMLAKVNIEPLLRATLLAARRRRRGRGGPKKVGKQVIVSYAEIFFHRHSPKKPSTDPLNPFHEFAERFYEVVTKTEPGGLDRQMRRVLTARRSGH